MSHRTTPVRDLIFPIGIFKKDDDGEFEMVSFLGTGFVFGKQGFALTAAHVVTCPLAENHLIMGMFVNANSNQWEVQNIDICDTHPKEDVALLKLSGFRLTEKAIEISFDKQFSAFEYKLFGYPYANFRENPEVKDQMGRVLGRPDLIYSSGHIRRRISFSVPGVTGKSLYELSQPVGAGCSGSPIFWLKGHTPVVVGIYLADKSESLVFNGFNEHLQWGLQTIELPGSLSYAVRMDSLSDWVPKKLGVILTEAP
mgnify:CR=1 FL=1